MQGVMIEEDEELKENPINDERQSWKIKSEFERQQIIRNAFIEELLPQTSQVVIDKFKNLPG